MMVVMAGRGHAPRPAHPSIKEVTQMQNTTPFSLRIPRELLERLKRLARCNKRSANREAEQILEEYIDRWEKEHPVP